jgi:hypothetical protein
MLSRRSVRVAIASCLCLPVAWLSMQLATVSTSAAAAPVDIVSSPIVGMAATVDGNGYWLVGSDSHVYNEGDALDYRSPYSSGGATTKDPTVAIAADPYGSVFWLAQASGAIWGPGGVQPPYTYGANACPGVHLNKPIVGMAVTPDSGGFYLVASDGGVFACGDAVFQGSMGGTPLNAPIVGMAIDHATGGYWLVAADGGIFSFNAPFYGSTGAIRLNKPIVGMEAAPDGSGYRMVASDGGIFCFNLPFAGSMGGVTLNAPIVGMAPHGTGGYWLVAADGGIFTFGGAPYLGTPIAFSP